MSLCISYGTFQAKKRLSETRLLVGWISFKNFSRVEKGEMFAIASSLTCDENGIFTRNVSWIYIPECSIFYYYYSNFFPSCSPVEIFFLSGGISNGWKVSGFMRIRASWLLIRRRENRNGNGCITPRKSRVHFEEALFTRKKVVIYDLEQVQSEAKEVDTCN